MGIVESQKQLYQKNPGNVHHSASLPRHTHMVTSPFQTDPGTVEQNTQIYTMRKEKRQYHQYHKSLK